MTRLREALDTAWARLTRRRLEAELDEELEYHIAREAAKYEAAGVPAVDARRRALAAFGALARTKEEVRSARGLGHGWSSAGAAVVRDVIQAIRTLRRVPRFSLTVLLLLGGTIGVSTTLFTVVDLLLFRPPAHAADPARIVRLVGIGTRSDGSPLVLTGGAWVDYVVQRDRATATTDHAAWTTAQMSLGRGEAARSILVAQVTPSYFTLLGVRPALGRFFTDEEDLRGAASGPAVISESFWRAALGGRPDVLGRELVIGTVTYTVVGVAPEGLTGFGLGGLAAWLPIQVAAGDTQGRDADLWSTDQSHWIQIAARLRPGISREEAGLDATRAYRSFTTRQRDPDLRRTVVADPILAARGSLPGRNAMLAEWLGYGALAMVVLVMANLVNLFLARNLSRGRETAVRLALGGSRIRIFRFLAAESLILAAAAGGVGLLLVAWLGPLARSMFLPGLAFSTGAVNLRIALFGVGAAVIIGVVVAAIMTLQSGRVAPAEAFRSGGAQVMGSRGGRRGRLVLVGVQAALSTALLAGSLGFVQSLRRALSTDLGMEVRSVLVGSAPLGAAGYDRQRQLDYYTRVHEAVSRVPGVVSASLGYTNPWFNNRNERVRLPGRDSLPEVPFFGAPAFDVATPEYLGTMGMRMVAGRWIEPQDRAGTAPVLVVNEALAALYWPGESPLGACMYIGADSLPCRTVIGVVANHRFTGSLDGPPTAAYFLPLSQSRAYNVVPRLFARVSGDPALVAVEVRRVLQSAAPNLPAADVRTMESQLAPNYASYKLGAFAFSGFGVLATLIAMAGLFGVLAYLVAARSNEFAVRSALGARPGQIAGPIIAQGVGVVLAGVLVGTGLTIWLAQWLQPLLFQTRLLDPPILLGIGALLVIVALLASAGPARLAGRKDPMQVLRS